MQSNKIMGRGNRMTENDKNDKYVENEYVCDWCSHKFKQKVRTSGTVKHNKVSTQIVCQMCGNFIKTWE